MGIFFDLDMLSLSMTVLLCFWLCDTVHCGSVVTTDPILGPRPLSHRARNSVLGFVCVSLHTQGGGGT